MTEGGNRLLDGFEGKLTSCKLAAPTKSSQGTAGRDIDDLLRRGVLIKNSGGGRSTSYSLALLPQLLSCVASGIPYLAK